MISQPTNDTHGLQYVASCCHTEGKILEKIIMKHHTPLQYVKPKTDILPQI